MRQKRTKAYRKLMALYHFSFGFREPYQVLIDSEICKLAVSQKAELTKQLGTVLQGTVKPMITQCCIHELYLQGRSQQPAVDLAKTFERRKCNHKEAIPGDDCISSVIGETNKHRYVVATLSHPLRLKLRAIPAVPIIHVNRSVMILEPPSDATLKAKTLAEQKALLPSASEKAQIASAAPTPAEPVQNKRRKGPKGPNPLSVKKKKVAPPPPKSGVKSGKNSQIGEKRKQDDEGDDERSEKGDEEGALMSGSGHKRKRRKKHRAGDAPLTAVSTTHDE